MIAGLVALATIAVAVVLLPSVVMSVLLFRLYAWGAILFLGFGGALVVTSGMFRVARTGKRPDTRGRRELWVAGAVTVVGVVAWFPAGSRLTEALVEPPLVAAMKSDLRSLVVAESLYYETVGTHAGDVAQLDRSAWSPSENVRVSVERADSVAWRARARHPRIKKSCTIDVERSANGRYGVTDPVCERR